MAADHFHPAIARWFAQRFEAPTEPQVHGWKSIRAGHDTLIAAPTGSGKTLAAFLSALDELLREGLESGGALPDETRVLYVSPLKALSADIHRNLAEPRREIRRVANEMGLPSPRITAAVRSGDTSQAERQAIVRTPPHILVTTPESLFLLLTAERSRRILRTVRTVIVDEIHAVIESRRGSHLALSLERLQHVAEAPLQRIGLSATQKPIEEVARFLVGGARLLPDGGAACDIVDSGHLRESDLALEVPESPLEAVMSAETWDEIFDRLAHLIGEHRTTLVFVNTRRMAERVARQLTRRLSEKDIAAHHGSLSREARLDAEQRLKEGELRALVATASLELGIDIGHVDLVCQLGSPNRISAFLQRVGRSGHTVSGTPKGRLFPLSRDDLVECSALLRACRVGALDRLIMLERPLDILAQQVIAESACEDWAEEELYDLFRRAYPYRALARAEFDEVVHMVAHGFRTRRGRRGAFVHHDGVNGRIRGRKGARLAALTAGGAIPDVADFRVVLEPEGTFVGTINEDFAIESVPGDIFQLGNTSWQILRIERGAVRVADARGQPPNLPFWFGEAPARTDELSAAVSELRRELDARLPGSETDARPANEKNDGDAGRVDAQAWLVEEIGLSEPAAFQLVEHLADAKHLLGVLPTEDTLVLERFFDEAGGMQLILHSPFGSRINKAWGLALRKRFCRKFNFELQAAATEDGVLLSLGPQHSFPLEEVFRYLHPETVRDVLVQAMLDAPVFQTRWRWAASLSLAVLRWRGGKRTPPQIQRMEAEDLLAATFPDAAACFENIEGEREVPDHPLVRQAIHDCLEEAMDLDGLVRVLDRIRAGEIALVARDTPEPSTLSHELLTASPYAFLDDAPLEERRAAAVYARRALDPTAANELGALDEAAIARVRGETWPNPRSPDELHDALLTCGFLTAAEGARGEVESPEPGDWRGHFNQLTEAGRATRARIDATDLHLWVATERLPELQMVHPEIQLDPVVVPPGRFLERPPDRDSAVRELLRGRVEILGPTTSTILSESLGVSERDAETALLALEGEGAVLRGSFTPGGAGRGKEWCDRRLLARIHRYTIQRLRAEIEPVSAADFMRFLFEWQHVAPGTAVAGPEGLAAVLQQLDGYELSAAAWEPDVLAARCEAYEPELLDALCLTGRTIWGRLSPPTGSNGGGGSGPIRSSPMAIFQRASAPAWFSLARSPDVEALSSYAHQVLETLERCGASFFPEIVDDVGLMPTRVEQALGELAAVGLVTSDGFTGLRALLTPSDRRRPLGGAKARRRRRTVPYGIETAGRWSLLRRVRRESAPESPPGSGRATSRAATRRSAARRSAAWAADSPEVETYALALLRRYGVVFHRLLTRETNSPAWRDLVLVYRRLEARGDIRGGRFVQGFSGEQFALSEAVSRLRSTRRAEAPGRLQSISGADPLNLTGIITPGDRIAAIASNRVVYRDGVSVAAHEAGRIRMLVHERAPSEREVERALARKMPPSLRWYLWRAG
jgi:ATP-dependent Lhr-like helicase